MNLSLNKALAKSTRKSYKAYWKSFCSFLLYIGLPASAAYPAQPYHIALSQG